MHGYLKKKVEFLKGIQNEGLDYSDVAQQEPVKASFTGRFHRKPVKVSSQAEEIWDTLIANI